ncbi:MAG TPA: signal peptidase I [Terracidiphilus sp.]|nr:signal peptidase I [Terracidiphilus sp.]
MTTIKTLASIDDDPITENEMTKKLATEPAAAEPAANQVEETPFEAAASICSVLVVGLFILTFLAQNFVIPSGSMENTLLVGDHLVVDRTTFAPPAKWMPLVHYRDPRRGDIVVFIKPVPDLDADGNPQYLYLVKRCVGQPGDRIHLHDGIVYVNGVAQPPPPEGRIMPAADPIFLDEFPAVPPVAQPGATPESWAIDFPNHVVDGDLVIPPGKYFMMGDDRHNSLDSRYWGFVPRENIVGRPLFNYWSFVTPEDEYEKPGVGSKIAWMGHVALHFFTDTRWSRTFKRTK